MARSLRRHDHVPRHTPRPVKILPLRPSSRSRSEPLAHHRQCPLRLKGTETIATELGPVQTPDAVLCRTNVGAMREVMQLLETGHRVALVGGGEALRALARAANDLKEGRRTFHPELILFPTWGELQDYADHDPAGGDLQPLVDLVETHGTDAILSAVDQLDDEQTADITVSTAHKAKGANGSACESPTTSPHHRTLTSAMTWAALPGPIDDGEARLAYVAVTRACHRLDIGGLSWINHHPDGLPA